MKTPPFEYHAPDTVEEALALLAEHGDEARILAGGQSLVPLMAIRLARPTHLIDVNGLTELAGIRQQDGTVSFGAMVRDREAERSDLVRDTLPLLAEALPFVGHVAIRNRGTIGGSIAHADASAELPAVALATDAEIVVRSTRGERTVPADEFFLGHFTTAIGDDECLVEVRVPIGPPDAGWCFDEIARRHGDFALVGVAAMVSLDGDGTIGEARIAMSGVAGRPVRVASVERTLTGQSPTAEVFASAAQDAVAGLEPASDVHGSAAFRSHLAGVAIRRCLNTATGRAGGPT